MSLDEVREVLRRHARTIALGGLLGALGALAWTATKAPTYRASATLLLDQDQGAGGLLGELASLSSAPAAASEIEILGSRSVAAEVVGRPRADDAVERERRPGLAAWADDGADRPLPAFVAGLRGEGPDAKERGLDVVLDAGARVDERFGLRVRFSGEDRVAISEDRLLARIGLGGANEREYEWSPGDALEYDGVRLSLEPFGDVDGRTFLVRYLPREEAVERVMQNTRARETERNSGVIRLTYTDSDPTRAARVVNALCGNYLARNEERSERRASQTVDFIDGQLGEQMTALAEAEREVVELQAASPSAVDVSESAAALIAELSELELERVRLRVARTGLEEALALIEAGDFAALSRVGPAANDPIVASYVETIAKLSSERELLGRSDASAYRTMVEQRLLEWRGELQRLEVHLASLRGIVTRLEAGDTAVLGSLADASGPGEVDPLMDSYLAQWTTVETRLRELRKDYKEGLPAIEKGMAELEELRGRIEDLLRGRVDGLEAQAAQYEELLADHRARLDGIPGREAEAIDGATTALRARTLDHLEQQRAGMERRARSLDDEVGRVEARLAELPEEQRRLADPMRRLESHAEIVKFLLAHQKEAEITRAATVATAEFIDRAVPPRRREGPSVPLHLGLGAAFGLAFASALAFLREGADRGVFTTAELEEASDLPGFGSIPDFRAGPTRVRGAGARFVALRDDPDCAAAEAYRSLRANLKFLVGSGGELRTIACTSCTQGEGKSTTNIDLALAFASGGARVLLVDADMRRPAVHHYLDTDRGPGLSEVLRDERAWRDCVVRGVADGLDVLPAGRQPRNPGDLLAGEASLRLLEETREAYDLVVLDVPPALAVADFDGFAARLDGVLLVVRSKKLSQGVVREAVKKLERVGANLVGTVLNASRPSRGERKYGYGYGYGYGADRAA